MKKHFVSWILASALGVGAIGGLVGCDNNKPNDGAPKPSAAGFFVDGDAATVSWNAAEGATGYILAAAGSRHGEYEDIAYIDGGKTTSYKVNDPSAYYRVTALLADASTVEVGTFSYELELFGYETHVYSPTDDADSIQNDFDEFYKVTYNNESGVKRGEFRSERFAALFKPGQYDVTADVGYYTALYGMGESPDAVTLSGMNVTSTVSLCNFWRTAENLAVEKDVTWAVSQATSLRRVHVKKNVALSYGDSTSGGFLADVKVDGRINQGSQQQWLTRNSALGGWSGNVWNSMFVGVEGDGLPTDKWDGVGSNYTIINESGSMREKPFLTWNETLGYRVFVPDAATATRGVSWSGEGGTPGKYISLDKFYIARSDRDTAATINAALASGKHLLLTAGIYELDAPLEVSGAGTVVLGIGLATLRASDKNATSLMRVANVGDVCIGGLLFDAGHTTSESLLEVGQTGEAAVGAKEAANATVTLSDLFFRVGGWTYDGASVKTCVVVNSDGVIGDNLWIWRADHSDMPYQKDTRTLYEGVGWDLNPADTGIIVNGDNATFYGLFVEHFLKYQTVFNGNGCTTYFYQSELPYDVPDAASWSPDGTTNGYASYYVADGVTTHAAYGLGVYSFLRDAAVSLDNAIVCPQTDGVNFRHMVTVWLSGNAQTSIGSIINGAGETANRTDKVRILESYPDNKN